VISDHLALAFAVATGVGLLATPLARRLARATGFLDHPVGYKGHRRPTPYLGGLAIIAAANVGALAGGAVDPTTGRVLLVATLLGAVGLIDDSGPLGVLPRLGCEVVAAAVIWGAGVRFQLTGSPVADGLFSLVWVVGITNAFNLLDNMDGLCGGTAALASLGIAGVALAAGQGQLAVLAFAVGGACVGFLAFNIRPATIFMGDSGSMFLGAAVAALTMAAHPPGSASVRAVVPLLIIGLPLLDTATVAIGRARRGTSVMLGGRDHLSHRLVALGLRPGAAVCTLLFSEAVSIASAIVVARGLVDAWLGLAAAAAALAAVWLWTSGARVYDAPVVGLPRVARWTMLAAVGGVIVLSGPAAIAMAGARSPLQVGASAAEAGVQHEQAGDTVAATQDFALAATSFSTARRRLAMAGVGAGRVVPVVAVNLRAATLLAKIGLNLSRSGDELVTATDVRTLRLRQGTVPVDTVDRLAPRLLALSGLLTRSNLDIHRLPRSLLLPQIRRAVDQLDAKLVVTAHQIQQSADAAAMVPAMLGANGPRRYLLAIQNNAEARATGGFIGNFGELIAQSGHISQGRFGRISVLNAPEGTDRSVPAPADYVSRYGRFAPFNLWQNMNMSPDFPTVGSVAAGLYARSGGGSVDGVIGVDPVALSDILRLTGPIQVALWPSPITADNVVEVTLQAAYDALPVDQRVAFLGDIARAAFDAMTSRDLGGPIRLAQALGPAVAQHHLQLYMTKPVEEAFASRLGASGAFGPAFGDQFLVTTQNASANKVDYYLRRSLNYQVTVDPASDSPQGVSAARVHGTLTVDLVNTAPDHGHSAEALGPYNPSLQPGENRTFLSLYTPLAVSRGWLDGRPLALEAATELGQHVYSSFVDIPPGATRAVSVALDGTIHLNAGAWYALELPRQPALGTDRVTVALDVPSGWQVQTNTAGSGWGRHADITLEAKGPERLRLRIRRTGAVALLDPVSSALASAPG
jgi:UDP-N-acetylmuramyl pentapeptide phosphotransferase/UDP-N-acetylglucosamine-1-phosphate transferase